MYSSKQNEQSCGNLCKNKTHKLFMYYTFDTCQKHIILNKEKKTLHMTHIIMNSKERKIN